MMVRNSRGQSLKKTPHHSLKNRTTAVLAVILFLLVSLIAKLVYLQVIRHPHFVEAASDQHNVTYNLAPERGKIYIQENYLTSTDLYPIAINKDFASLFAIPQDIDNPEEIAEKIYIFFKEEEVKKEVELRLQRERKDRLQKNLEVIKSLPEGEQIAAEEKARLDHEQLLHDPVFLDFENEKREELIKEQHDLIVADFTNKLSKPNDTYELIEKKLEEEKLKEFFLYMQERTDISDNDLEIKNNAVFIKNDSSELTLPGFGFARTVFRYYPEKNVAANMLGFASYEDQTQRGKYGLEGFFDEDLYGKVGSVRAEKGAGGLVIVNDRQSTDQINGKSLVLTIDRAAQFTACRELDEEVKKHGADGGSVIIVDPKTGAILAMCSAPDFDPNNYNLVSDISVYNNPAIFDQYEPGSVFKAITMAAALDQNKVTPETTYVDKGQIMIKGWPKPISNSDFSTFGGHGTTTMVKVLEQSLNTGAIFAMEQVGVKKFSDYVRAFGFGEKTGIELEGEAVGDISSINGGKVKEISAATASFGQGISVTPLQMVMSFAAIANGGELLKPYIVKEIISPDGQRTVTKQAPARRVISERTASLLTGMLINVVENGHSKALQTPGYYIAGKTGTAQVASSVTKGYSGAYNHTFIGYAPADNPSFVILTKINNPKGVRYAESTAVPLARDISQFLLNHWQIKKDRAIDEKK
jgi:cell division protein FtsI/penicillin-binding protein 2